MLFYLLFDFRVGKEGQGFYLAMSALDGARLSVAACSIGAAFASMEIAINYLKVFSFCFSYI